MVTLAPELPGVVQVGPALDVRGGVSAVERLIVDHVGPHITVQHVATMEDGPTWQKLKVFVNAARELRIALKQPGPVIVHIHFASRGSTLRKAMLAWMTTLSGRQLVLHAHGASFDVFFDTLPRWVQRVLAKTFARADRFVVLSSQWKDFYVKRCGLAEERIAVLINPTPLPAALPDRSQRERVQFVFLGRIGERKGAFDLVRAFRSLPDQVRDRARLIIAGDGEVDALREQARDLHGQVVVHSWIEREQRDALLMESDVFVLPSRSEGVPMALLEAMAHGLAVIATPVGGIPDVVTPHVEGLLIAPGDTTALARALQTMIEDASRRLEFGNAARARAERFDVVGYTERLLDLYRQLLAERSARSAS